MGRILSNFLNENFFNEFKNMEYFLNETFEMLELIKAINKLKNKEIYFNDHKLGKII